VELILVTDNGELTRGAKRQIALNRANGQYVCHYDDDDVLPEGWLTEILKLLFEKPVVDCVELRGVMQQEDGRKKRFHHSIRYKVWKDGPVDVRPPNHCAIVRTELARKAGFRDMQFAEDKDFSLRVAPLCKIEARTEAILYEYRPRVKRSVME
jgi:cellulose synthase/poly-beta-1,6-N-acetylglucosamine synthase-like glycosyltransferase